MSTDFQIVPGRLTHINGEKLRDEVTKKSVMKTKQKDVKVLVGIVVDMARDPPPTTS